MQEAPTNAFLAACNNNWGGKETLLTQSNDAIGKELLVGKILLFFLIVIMFTPAVTSAETYWKRGMAIGAGAGAAAGLGVGLGVALGGKCSGGGENECGSLKWVALAGFPVFGAIVGTGVGTLIGACIKKDEAKQVSVEPYVMPSRGGIEGGLNMTIAGW